MKKLLSATLLILTNLFIFSQVTATYEEVISKQKKGNIDVYISESGEEYREGDTLTLGSSANNENFDFIQQQALTEFYPLQNVASNSKVVIKKMKAASKMIYVYTTKPQGYVYGLVISNIDAAVKNGEIKSNIMTSDQALAELKKWKDKLDLGLVSEEEYNKKKEELAKLIK